MSTGVVPTTAGSGQITVTIDADTAMLEAPELIHDRMAAKMALEATPQVVDAVAAAGAAIPASVSAAAAALLAQSSPSSRITNTTMDATDLIAQNIVTLPAISTPVVQVQSVVHRSPQAPELLTLASQRRMLYKVKFHAHLEDGRLVLLEDVGFEANAIENNEVFLEAISSLDVCKRIMEALSISSFQAECVTVKIAFNEPGHGYKGRKQYLWTPEDWKAMYSLFFSLKKKTTIYMTFDIRRKLKGIHNVTAAAVSPVAVSSAKTPSRQSASVRASQSQTSTSGTPVNGSQESAAKRILQSPSVAAAVMPIELRTDMGCPNCSAGTMKKLEVRCALRERLLTQLKMLTDLGAGRLAEVDEDVLRRVQQDTVEDIQMLCNQSK